MTIEKQEKIPRHEYLKQLRKFAGMDQYQAAAFLGISRATYQTMEYGQSFIGELTINKFETKLGLIEFKHQCPHCEFCF